jgi:hypothetical protein
MFSRINISLGSSWAICLSILYLIAWWILAWGRFGFLSEYAFFPLWLGYILLINIASEYLFGHSLMRKMGISFALLFLGSISLWWFFEGANSIVQNWHYVLPHPISTTHYVIEASIDFSTVIPAVMSTTYLVYQWARKQGVGSRARPQLYITNKSLTLISVAGIVCFVLIWLFPREAFPLVWVAPTLILEPLADAAGLPSWLRETGRGRYRLALACMVATFVTGICWEFWNFYSMPKWYYTIPYVGFWKVFEMPLLGYFGYPFFGLTIFSYSAVLLYLFGKENIIEIFRSESVEA